MAYRTSEFGLMVRLMPREAATLIVTTAQSMGGNEKEIATALGCGVSSLKRYIAVLEQQGFNVVSEVAKVRVIVREDAKAKRKDERNKRRRERRKEVGL